MYHQIKCHISCFWYLGLSIEMPSLSVLVNGMRSVIIVKHIMDYGWWRLSQSDSESCVSISPSDHFTSRLRTHLGPVTRHEHVTHVTKHTQGKLFRKWVDSIASWNILLTPQKLLVEIHFLPGLGWAGRGSCQLCMLPSTDSGISPPTSHSSRRPPKAWED